MATDAMATDAVATDSAQYLSGLLAQMSLAFSQDELKTLCFELGVDYDNLAAETKDGRMRELILQFARAGRLPALLAGLRAQRSGETWPDPPPNLELFGDDPFNPTPFQRLDFEPETVRVPGGPFLMGSDADAPEEAPRHTVDLPGFAIGVVPVTNEQYARFVWDVRRVVDPILRWDGNSPPADRLDHPVLAVTWREAFDYCRWLAGATGRPYALPSEAQWEKAARGTAGGLYPWGEAWDAARCNAAPDAVTPVRAFPPQNDYGVYDMVGNGREWTMTAWGSDPNAPDRAFAYPWQNDRRESPDQPLTTRRVFRGGRASNPRGFRCSARGSFAADGQGPRANRIGFRVVLLDS